MVQYGLIFLLSIFDMQLAISMDKGPVDTKDQLYF